MTRSIVVGCLGVAMFCASGLTPAAAPRQAPLRPFQAQLTMTANLTPETDPCYFINREVGTAISSQLGELTWSDIETVNFCSVADGVSVTAQFSLTASDGSRIFGTFNTTGSFTAVGGIELDGRFRFEGGSGRYAGIQGSGSLSAVAPPQGSPDPVKGEMVGLYRIPR